MSGAKVTVYLRHPELDLLLALEDDLGYSRSKIVQDAIQKLASERGLIFVPARVEKLRAAVPEERE